MMISPHIAQEPERSRVSIIERVVPSFSLALAAISGAAAAAWMQVVLGAMRNAENAGYAAFYNAMGEVYAIGEVGLTTAAGVGLCGIGWSAARMFTNNKRSSPPGLLFLFPAGLCLLPPLLTDYAGWLAISAVNSQAAGGVSSVANTVGILNWLAIGVAVFSFLVLAAFSFIPFNSRAGRKFSPVICLIVIEAAIAALAVSFLLDLLMCWSLAEANY